jgi:hypothetical protein
LDELALPRFAARSRALVALAAVGLAVACGGGGSGAGSSGGGATAGFQAYDVHWQQPPGETVDGYVLALGTQSGVYDASREVEFSISAARPASDGTLRYQISLDRSRDQFLMLRAFNAGGISAPSNELRVPALGAASVASAPAATAPSGQQATANGPSTEAATTAPVTNTSTTQTAAESEAALDPAADAGASDEPLRSLDLNGADEHLATTGSAQFAADSFTLSLWARADEIGIGRASLFRMTCAQLACSVELVLDATAEPALELWRGDVTGVRTLLRRVPLASWGDDWWHVAAAVDGGAGHTSLYLDGMQVAIEAVLPTPSELDASTRIGFALGAPGTDSAGWNGRLGHAAFFARALDAAEIEAIALGGHSLDLRTARGAEALTHYWRLGADSASVGRDFGAQPLHLDDPAGFVDGADIANDAPLARPAGSDPRTQ